MKTRLVTTALACVLAPALVLAQKVSYDYDKAADFASFKTYSHKEGTKVGQVLAMEEKDLLAIRNFGQKSLDELREKLIQHGFLPEDSGGLGAGGDDEVEDEADAEDIDLSLSGLGLVGQEETDR